MKRSVEGTQLTSGTIVILVLFLGIMGSVPEAGTGESTCETRSTGFSEETPREQTDWYNGYTLFQPGDSDVIHLMDSGGNDVHTWSPVGYPGHSVYLLENGTLIRCAIEEYNPTFNRGGFGSNVQMLDWDGNLMWNFSYSTEEYCLHHDIAVLPNGNILMLAWELKTEAEAIAAGRNPLDVDADGLWIGHIIEVKPTGLTTGDIVWEWHAWDHMIQDHNPAADNYGVVEDHPELLDLNYMENLLFGKHDWLHLNSIDYNQELDQILLTSQTMDEVYVIDHGTTTQEAAGHTGGRRGRGGDILYRWGNPLSYRAGDKNDRMLFGPHDAQWIPSHCPGAGNILIFNNGLNRPDSIHSSVDEIVPPVDVDGNYTIGANPAFGPTELAWTYESDPPDDFYTEIMGGTQRLPNGNTLICESNSGYLFEVEPDGDIVWDHLNLEPDEELNKIFKVRRYYPPRLDTVPTQRITEDVPYTLDLSLNITDPDTVNCQFTILEDSPHVEVDGLSLDFLYPDGVGSEVFNLILGDGAISSYHEIRVEVTPVNDPPILSAINDLFLEEDVPYLLDMRDHVTDVDTAFDDLEITEESEYAEVQNGIVTFNYPENVLWDRVNITVSDGEFQVFTSINLTITPVNDPPLAQYILPITVMEDVPHFLDMDPYIVDDDTPNDELTITVDSEHVTVTGLILNLTYPDGIMGEWLEIRVSDGELSDTTFLDVTVTPVNDPPGWTDSIEISAVEDIPGEFDLSSLLTDPDTPPGDLVVTADSDFGHVENNLFIFTYPEGVVEETFNLTVTDGEFNVTIRATAIVTPVNDPPVLSEAGVSPQEGNTSTIFIFQVSLKDVDSAEPEVWLVLDDEPYPCSGGPGSFPDGIVFTLETNLTAGNHTYRFTVDDGDGGTVNSTQMELTVTPTEDTGGNGTGSGQNGDGTEGDGNGTDGNGTSEDGQDGDDTEGPEDGQDGDDTEDSGNGRRTGTYAAVLILAIIGASILLLLSKSGSGIKPSDAAGRTEKESRGEDTVSEPADLEKGK